MNNNIISSIRINCNKINNVVKFCFYLFVIIALSSVFYTIFLLYSYGNSLEVFSFKNEFVIHSSKCHIWVGGNISRSLVTSSSDQPFSNLKLAFIIAQIIAFIKNSLIIPILYFVNKILNNIETNYTPFTIENARKIKLVGLLLIAYSIIPNLVAYPLLNSVTESVSLDIDSSLPMIFAASFILLLSKIFTYGCELQKDSDETL